MTIGGPSAVGRGGGESGSATVLVLALCLVLVTAGAGSLALLHVVAARHRAGAAADLAALAAASRVQSGQPRAACPTAQQVAASAGAQLLRCDLGEDVVSVVAEVPLRGALGGLGPARVPARAGPVRPSYLSAVVRAPPAR